MSAESRPEWGSELASELGPARPRDKQGRTSAQKQNSVAWNEVICAYHSDAFAYPGGINVAVCWTSETPELSMHTPPPQKGETRPQEAVPDPKAGKGLGLDVGGATPVQLPTARLCPPRA